MNLQQSFELVVKELKPADRGRVGRVVKEIILGHHDRHALRNLEQRGAAAGLPGCRSPS